MLTTQIILCGVAFSVEVQYRVYRDDPSVGIPETLEIENAYLVSYFPDGIESSDRQSNAQYLNVKCDLEYLTIEEFDTLENACWEHHRKALDEAWNR